MEHEHALDHGSGADRVIPHMTTATLSIKQTAVSASLGLAPTAHTTAELAVTEPGP
jgi:hypothetical protein